MDVRFLRGLSTTFKAEGFAKDNKTFYYLTDTNELYLGALLLSNEITATAFAALEGRVKALEDLDLQGQIDGIKEALKSIASNETVAALDSRVEALEIWKNGLPEYVTKATYDAHLTTQSEKDAAQDALIAGKEEAGVAAGLVASLKTELQGEINGKENSGVAAGLVNAAKEELQGSINGVDAKFANYRTSAAQDEIDAAKDKALEDAVTELQGAIDDVSEIAEAAQTAEEVGSAIDAKIAALNLATTYEPIGAEQRAKDYSDGKLNAVVEQYLTGEGAKDTIDTLNEIAAWINTDEAGVAKIIADVAANSANISTVSSDLDKVEAKLSDVAEGKTVKALVDEALQAAKDYADENDANTVYDDTALAGRVSGLEGKVDVAKVSEAIAAATTDMATNASVDGKLAGKVDKATYEAYVEAHKDDYNNAKVDELVAAAQSAAEGKAATAQAAAEAAQGEVDALEEVVAANAKTCSDNFNTISNQLTWGSF